MSKENDSIMKPEFKKGDKITLNTGYSCDRGVFQRWEGDNAVWKDKLFFK